MNRNSMTLGIIMVGFIILTLYWNVSKESQERAYSLPGVGTVIDAAEYGTLQEAINAIPQEGGIITIPPGTFEITEPLTITQNDILIRGSGSATHIKNASTSGQPAIIIEPKPGTDQEEAEPLWRIQLSDFRITGNPESGHGIVAANINEIFISGVSVSYHGGDGIRLDHCYEDPRISNSLITYNAATGLNLIGCHDIVVQGNQFEENQDALRCTDGYNLCMTGNNLDDHLGNGVVIENTYGSVVTGNMIEECQKMAIVLDRDCYGINLGSNVIAHNGGGIDLRDAHGCAVSANTFTIMKTHALRIGNKSGRITVTGNNFANSYIGNGEVKRGENDLAAAGITLEGTSHIAIDGNVFADLTPKSVEVVGDPSSRILFTDNVLVDVEGDYNRLQQSIIENMLQSFGEE